MFQSHRGRSSWIEPVLSYDKCVLLKDHNAVKLEAVAHMTRVKHSTTEPLCSQRGSDVFLGKLYNFPRFQRGFNILRGGGCPTNSGGGGGGGMHRNLSKLGFSMQGVQCRGPRPSIPPLWIHACSAFTYKLLDPSNRSTYFVCVRAWQDRTKFSQASPVSQRFILEQDTLILQPRKTRPNVTERLLTGT